MSNLPENSTGNSALLHLIGTSYKKKLNPNQDKHNIFFVFNKTFQLHDSVLSYETMKDIKSHLTSTDAEM